MNEITHVTSQAELATLCVETALAQLQEARTIDEVVDIRDRADALTWLVRRRKASTAAGADAWLIARNAERRIGQMTGEIETTPGARTDIEREPSPDGGQCSKKETLKSIGLTRQKASTFEQMAKLDDTEWSARTAAIHADVIAGRAPANILAHTSAIGLDKDAYGTPPEWLEPGRELLDGFDLDPCSNDTAQRLVQAVRYFTKELDARVQDWQGADALWMNPPYSKGLIDAMTGLFVDYVRERMQSKHFRGALMLVNNASDTRWWHRCAKHATGILHPEGRIAFLDEHAQPVKGNDHAQTLLYYGPKLKGFHRLYGERGLVTTGYAPRG